MPKIKLLVGRAGHGFSNRVGDVLDVDATTAKRMIESKQAVPTADPTERERMAVAPKPQARRARKTKE